MVVQYCLMMWWRLESTLNKSAAVTKPLLPPYKKCLPVSVKTSTLNYSPAHGWNGTSCCPDCALMYTHGTKDPHVPYKHATPLWNGVNVTVFISRHNLSKWDLTPISGEMLTWYFRTQNPSERPGSYSSFYSHPLLPQDHSQVALQGIRWKANPWFSFWRGCTAHT